MNTFHLPWTASQQRREGPHCVVLMEQENEIRFLLEARFLGEKKPLIPSLILAFLLVCCSDSNTPKRPGANAWK